MTDTESQDRSMLMETWTPRTQRDAQATASLLHCRGFPPYVTVKHLPQCTHRMYQPFNAFCKVSKQLTRCWCPPEFITTRFSYARKKKNVLFNVSLSEGELPQLLFSQVRFIQVIKGRLDFIPELHPHFDSCRRTAPILEAGNKGRPGIGGVFLEQLAPGEQQAAMTF